MSFLLSILPRVVGAILAWLAAFLSVKIPALQISDEAIQQATTLLVGLVVYALGHRAVTRTKAIDNPKDIAK